MESLFIEITKENFNSTKNIIIGIIYRPPGTNLETYLLLLNDMLAKMTSDNKNIYIMGDFNINILNSDSHVLTSQFVETMYSKSLFPLINKPTRIHNESATLIDNIFSNNIFDNKLVNGIFLTDISDHLPVFTIVSDLKIHQALNHIKSRSSSIKNHSLFTEKLKDTTWDDILQCPDGKLAFTNFHNRILKLFNNCFPLKEITINYSNKKPWLTTGLKKSIKIKNMLYIKAKRNYCKETLDRYKRYKSKLSRLMKISERDYFNNKILSLKDNAKKTWSVIKNIINKQKAKRYTESFMIDDNLINDGNVIVDKFNEFFANIGTNLANKIPRSSKNASDFIDVDINNTIFLRSTDNNEIKTVIKMLKDSSPGWDNITASCLKNNHEILCPIITHLVNLSLTQGFFPNELKTAKVVPLFKSEDSSLFTNYRPVSILSVISKIFERIMHSRITEFIIENKIIYEYQFGFREGYNTTLALTTLVDKISCAVGNNELVIGLFLDFKKAFDTINHNILFDKLFKYGVRGLALDWLKDYLYNRNQFVIYNNSISSKKSITCGVPQGSILGPLLFLLYINDLPNCSSLLHYLLFADDTSLFISGKNINDLVHMMNNELSKITDWLECNRLSLNIKKTKFMIFSSKRPYTIKF